MRQFQAVFRSFEDIRDFVFLATEQSFAITVSNGIQCVDAKSLMVMFSLDYSRPLLVRVDCSEEEFSAFLEKTVRFRP